MKGKSHCFRSFPRTMGSYVYHDVFKNVQEAGKEHIVGVEDVTMRDRKRERATVRCDFVSGLSDSFPSPPSLHHPHGQHKATDQGDETGLLPTPHLKRRRTMDLEESLGDDKLEREASRALNCRCLQEEFDKMEGSGSMNFAWDPKDQGNTWYAPVPHNRQADMPDAGFRRNKDRHVLSEEEPRMQRLPSFSVWVASEDMEQSERQDLQLGPRNKDDNTVCSKVQGLQGESPRNLVRIITPSKQPSSTTRNCEPLKRIQADTNGSANQFGIEMKDINKLYARRYSRYSSTKTALTLLDTCLQSTD